MSDGHGERKHAKYSGSNVFRFRRCPAQARFARSLNRPARDTQYAEEGTKVHELLEWCLTEGHNPTDHEHYSEKRYASVEYVLNYVAALRVTHPDIVIRQEQIVYFPQNVVPKDDCCGLADIVWFSPSAGVGGVIDYKNGYQIVDDPEYNDQLWFYGTAAFWSLPVSRVTLAIIQPNGPCAPVREHTIDATELLQFAADINKVLMDCEASDARLVPGDWCTSCGVGAECGAREREAIEALTGKPGPHTYLAVDEIPKAGEIDVARWAAIRAKAKFIRKWLDDIDDAALAYALEGGEIPGEKLVQANPRRQWSAGPRGTAEALSELLGVPAERFLETDVIGITKAEALVKEAAKKAPNPDDLRERFARLTFKQSSGNLSLVSVDDKRPAYNAAKSTFGLVLPAEE